MKYSETCSQRTMATKSRLLLFQTLSALPAPQFEQLRFTLNPPPGVVPESVAAQGNRVSALLSWVEGAMGCGLERLYEVVEQIGPGDGVGQVGEMGGVGGEEPPWMVPYPRNPCFTGRDEILTTLYRQLHEGQTATISQTQAISGLGASAKPKPRWNTPIATATTTATCSGFAPIRNWS